MMTDQVNRLFARSEAAFREGRGDDARVSLQALLRLTGEHPAVLHLLALVEQRAGRGSAARDAFARALRVAPDDPQINNNYANLLDDLGDTDGALRHYDRALARTEFIEARLNRAMLYERLGILDSAENDARRVVTAASSSPAGHSVLGSILRRKGLLDEAAIVFDAALAIAPSRGRALHGRARVALERGEPTAASFYERTLAVLPDDDDVILGLASALEADGDPRGVEMIEEALVTRPLWLDGHRELIRMRSEGGERTSATRSLDVALAAAPYDTALHQLRWQTLAQMGRHGEALTAIRAASHLTDVAPMRLAEAICTDESGDHAAAARLFATLDDALPDIAVAHARHFLRTGQADRAASILEEAVAREPGDMSGWAHLDLAWRVMGSSRHPWLSGNPALIGTSTIDFQPEAFDQLAETLRDLHRSRAHPIGQSLRGGTQTRGALLLRTDPILRRLRSALERGIATYIDTLPPADPVHPLLRHRAGSPQIVGSWSVRLTASGFHVSHIHPQGLISSACHIALPCTPGEDPRAGALELGTSPAELGLNLPPIASIEPHPGRLTLFPSYLFHGTRPFAGGERLTVAFDVVLR